MKTSSVWGIPPSRFYRFLRHQEEWVKPEAAYDLAVLGCADGKFVLPAARKGLRVLAVDVDRVAIEGGKKPGVGGTVHVPGLVQRVKQERVSQMVDILVGDFTKITPREASMVWVSGAIQYSFNSHMSARDILEHIMMYVAVDGLLYIDYMLPYEAKYRGRANCPDQSWWETWLSGLCADWKLLHRSCRPPVLDKAHVEYPVDHYHQWGHVLLRRFA